MNVCIYVRMYMLVELKKKKKKVDEWNNGCNKMLTCFFLYRRKIQKVMEMTITKMRHDGQHTRNVPALMLFLRFFSALECDFFLLSLICFAICASASLSGVDTILKL